MGRVAGRRQGVPVRRRRGGRTTRVLPAAGLHALIACTAALVDEVVIGADVAAEWSYGEPSSRYGAVVAVGGEIAVAAPGAGQVWVGGVASEGPSDWVGYAGSRLVRANSTGLVTADDAVVVELDGATAWAAGEAGIAVSSQEALVLVGEWTVPVPGIEAVAVGRERVFARAGESVAAWSLDGEPLGEVMQGGEGGAVAEVDGVLWAGAPANDADEGRGQVCSEHGDCVEGEPGDHLGRALGGGYAAGVFNKWIVPARARFVPLDGGAVYAMEVGAEGQDVTVTGDVSRLVFGAPYYPREGEPAGAVAVVSR